MIDVRGKTLVLTGDFGTYKRAEAEALLQARGARCSGSVSKKTDLVFAGMGAGSKLDKARALGVPVYDEAALVAILKEPVATDTAAADSQRARAAAPAAASPTATGPGNGVFLADSDWSALREPDTAMAALRRADWSALAVQRDVPRLRAALASHPSPGEAHVAATAALRARGAQLVHCRPHFTEMVSFALSPDGQHLASGAWVGDDYDRGATLALWEVAAGRCVRVIDPISGGVGWPEYERQLQFSRDGKLLGVGVNTNGVGLWDAFGAGPDSLGEAYITDGWSRPPAWCLSPEGTRAFISCWVGAEVPGAIVALVSDTRRRVSAWGHRAVKPLPMAKKLPKAVKDKINDKDPGIQPYKFVRWSDDGSRVYGHNNHNQGFAIDVKSGSILWLTTLHAPVAWSPDGKWIAHCPAGLVFYDGTTGLPTLELPMHVGPEALYFALRGATARLASLVCANNQFAAEPGVFLYTDGKFVEGLDARPQPRRWDDGELAAWAWSADGTCGVLLNDAGALEHWDLSGARGQKLATWPSFEGARGVLYADGVIVVVSRARICFVRASDGAVLGDHDQLREPRTERPLELDGVDLGADLRPDPTFNLDADTWAVAFAGGAVIAPSGRRAELDARLAWVLERRVAWPTAWGELTVLPSVSAAAGHAGVPQELPLDRFPSSPAPAAATFPPENEVSDEELFSLAVNSVARLSPGWSSHVSDNLSLVSRLRARRGEHAAAQAVVTAIPEPLSRMVATACWATIAAGRGDPAAQTALTLLEAMNLDALDEKSVPWVAAALGAAFHASRRDSQARFWFARAEQSIEPEVNGWQKRLALAWAYTEAGLDERAAALWADAAVWQSAPSSFYYEPWFAYLVRTERDAVLAAFLKRWKKAGSLDFQVQWFVPTLYAQRGRAAGLSAIAKVLGVKVRDEDRALCKRRRVGTRVVPSADDIAALVRSYDEIQSLPRARRGHPMRELAERCATLGHFGAARALLLQLDDTDMNNRPGAAFRILYCAMTGSMTEPW